MSKSSQKNVESREASGGSGKNNRTLIAVIVACTLVIVIVVCAAIWYMSSKKDSGSDKKRDVVVTKDNIDDIIKDQEKTDKSAASYVVTMQSTSWNFKNGTSTSDDSYVENSTLNSHDVYFDIVRSDTGETIYSSPVIPVGSHLSDFKLDKDLDAGSYDCVMTYYLVDSEQKVLSHVNLSLTINVAE